jgi:hypothetical protein
MGDSGTDPRSVLQCAAVEGFMLSVVVLLWISLFLVVGLAGALALVLLVVD